MLRISKAAKIRGGEEVDESIKKPWLPAEDQLLCDLVVQHGVKNWSAVSHAFKERTGKHCRERWYNHLNPEIKKGNWTQDDDRIIMTMHKEFGNQWAKITKCLPGRTDNAVKNRYNAILRAIKKKNRKENSKSLDQHSDVSGDETADSDCTDEHPGGKGRGESMSLARMKPKKEKEKELKHERKEPEMPAAPQLLAAAYRLDCNSSSSNSSSRNEISDCNAIMSQNSSFSVDGGSFPANLSAHATAAPSQPSQPSQHATPRSSRENRSKVSNDMETNNDNGDGGNIDGTPRNSIGSWDSGVQDDPLFDLDFDSIAEWDFVQDSNPYAYGGGGGGGGGGSFVASTEEMVGECMSNIGSFVQNVMSSNSGGPGVDPGMCSNNSLFSWGGSNNNGYRSNNNNSNSNNYSNNNNNGSNSGGYSSQFNQYNFN